MFLGESIVPIILKESDDKFVKKTNKAIADELNRRIRKNKKRIENEIKSLIGGWIKSTPEMSSLTQEGVFGSLNAQFGLYPGQGESAVQSIIGAIIGSVSVVVNTVQPKMNRSIIEFKIQPIAFENLLSLPDANVVQSSNGKVLPWLDWLLNLGNTVIVGGYTYVPESLGRSGGGTMNPGAGWRVPPQYAGTQNNNFITRALSGREKQINPILKRILNA